MPKAGLTGILVQGSNGEAQHLSHDERSFAIKLTRDTLDEAGFKNTLVIAGTGAQTTRETKKLNEDAKAAGASHALILTPSTWAPKMNNDAILRFHREVRTIPVGYRAPLTNSDTPGGRRLANSNDGLQLPDRDRRDRP
jgi:4-hydroxy-2-oxoglutarate aldolase